MYYVCSPLAKVNELHVTFDLNGVLVANWFKVSCT